MSLSPYSPGDLARVEENVTGAGTPGKYAKDRKTSSTPDKECKFTEGVVYKVIRLDDIPRVPAHPLRSPILA